MKDRILEDVRLIYRHLSVTPDRFNPDGKRTVTLVLSEEQAHSLEEEGYSINWREPTDGTDADPIPTLKVEASYRFDPPRVVMITSRQKVKLGEDLIGQIDHAEVIKADVRIHPSVWHYPQVNPTRSGVKAYLKTLFVTIAEDELELKYADIPYASEEEDYDEEVPFED